MPVFEIRVADQAGACFGVERALRLAKQTRAESQGPVHTLGPLIHNPRVVRDLEENGIAVVERPEDAPRGTTIVMRTHGVEPAVEDRAREAGLTVVDATCPFVKRVHKAARMLADEGYQVMVVGESGHPEVEGTLGHAPGSLVVGGAGDLCGLKIAPKVGLVVQTTLDARVLREVVDALVEECGELRLINTICDATSKRQHEAALLAAEADVMIVLGGKNSANTCHLAEICARCCMSTHHIEGPHELEDSWFEGARLVGVTAGASTPAEHIEELVLALRRRRPVNDD